MAMFGDKSKADTRPAPPASLNNTTVAIPIGSATHQFLPRSKSAIQFTTSESVQENVQQPTYPRKATLSRKSLFLHLRLAKVLSGILPP